MSPILGYPQAYDQMFVWWPLYNGFVGLYVELTSKTKARGEIHGF